MTRDLEHLPGPAEELRPYFPALAHRWIALRGAIEAAIGPTMLELQESIAELRQALGEDGLSRVGEAVKNAARSANNERAFTGSASLVDVEDAAQRLRESKLDAPWWIEFDERQQGAPATLSAVLEAVPESPALTQVTRDLRFAETSLKETRALLNARMEEEGGVRSLDQERLGLIKTRDEVLGVVAEILKVASR
jgi:hypothetical protein